PRTAALRFLPHRKLTPQANTVTESATKLFGKKNDRKTWKYCYDAVLSQETQELPMEYLYKKNYIHTTKPRRFTQKNRLAEL
ncbi:protoporphyrinogen oxidase, partial [Francisella tularensis subsp. holarctica]|nr:protoporphyrinogen oxidase [Francisella tularensis subsp. holarctica]